MGKIFLDGIEMVFNIRPNYSVTKSQAFPRHTYMFSFVNVKGTSEKFYTYVFNSDDTTKYYTIYGPMNFNKWFKIDEHAHSSTNDAILSFTENLQKRKKNGYSSYFNNIFDTNSFDKLITMIDTIRSYDNPLMEDFLRKFQKSFYLTTSLNKDDIKTLQDSYINITNIIKNT